MSDRPYFQASIVQLELLFKEANGNGETLQRIFDELRFRTTQRSLQLRHKVEGALKAKVLQSSTFNHETESDRNISSPRGPIQAAVNIEPQGNQGKVDIPINHVAKTGGALQENHPNTESASTSGAEQILSENQSRLLDLLEYLEHLAKLGEKPIFSLREYQQLLFSEADFKGQIGITHDLSDDQENAWLRIERLQRAEPPQPPVEIKDWVVVSRDPNQPPAVKEVLTRTLSPAEFEMLVQSGTAKPGDEAPSLKSHLNKLMLDVNLRLEAQTSIRQAIDNFITTKWTPWAEIEKPRRVTIGIYDKFFTLYQSLQAEGVERPLELIWGVGVVRWKVKTRDIDHPLIEQLVEMYVDTESGVITLSPRSAGPQLALKPYFSLEIDGVDETLSFAKQFFEALPQDKEFSPFQRSTFEPVLRYAATHLDSSGRYFPDTVEDINDRSLPPIASSLVITDTWAIYARARSANFFIEDLERLRTAVTRCPKLPGPCTKFVETPSSETAYSPTLVDITKATLGDSQSVLDSEKVLEAMTQSGHDFFFPKPFNADQVAIVQCLEEAEGVVVQGPPGTGKTHTIANIICHYLATGRKVLVTSKGESALATLRDEHIPEGIRDLTISLLTNEREGLKQLESAVNLLANTATRMNPLAVEKQIIAGQQQIVDLKKRLASIDSELSEFAKKHLNRIPHKTSAEGLLPIELAQLIANDPDRHLWLPDHLKLDADFEPIFNEDDIAGLRQARRVLGKDLCYATKRVPALADLPDTNQVLAVHDTLGQCELVERKIKVGQFPRLRINSSDCEERCKVLRDLIKQIVSAWTIVDELVWLKPFLKRWTASHTESDSDKPFESLLTNIAELRKKRTESLMYAISCPDSII